MLDVLRREIKVGDRIVYAEPEDDYWAILFKGTVTKVSYEPPPYARALGYKYNLAFRKDGDTSDTDIYNYTPEPYFTNVMVIDGI